MVIDKNCIICFLDRKKDNFEIQKKENSIQKKRQYRTNKDDSSASESDKDKSSDRRVFIYIYFIFSVLNIYIQIQLIKNLPNEFLNNIL